MSYHGHKDGLGEVRASPTRVGFWWSMHDSLNAKFPRVEQFVDPTWNRSERNTVLTYLRLPTHHRDAYRGWSDCRVCGKVNGSEDVSDGTYVWPSGFDHYIEAHGVKPPQEFVDHVLRIRR